MRRKRTTVAVLSPGSPKGSVRKSQLRHGPSPSSTLSLIEPRLGLQYIHFSAFNIFKGSIRLLTFERPSVPAAPGSHTVPLTHTSGGFHGKHNDGVKCFTTSKFNLANSPVTWTLPTHADVAVVSGSTTETGSTSEDLGVGVVPLLPDPQPTSLPNPTSKRALTRPTSFIRYLHQRALPHRIIFPSTT